ncbi:TolC family outer membrane protein [Aliidiomarina quisquiliarum]|uniref:TolC family outer membrane protein n=1 Tax=Aliidiomarina quisquiliarum TaxID=2938947 RepID=UPI00208FBD4A|nr:TolC family outer membrane protein [Aliidiomarina quisquiliarum]MCO4322139.1 TolC family outer membrane protein [Aliidiomarina quisquiliarum]
MNKKKSIFIKRSAVHGLSLAALIATMPASASLERAVNQALNQNPEVRQMWREVLLSDADIDIASGDVKPNVDLVSGYDFTDRNYSNNRTFSGAFAEVQLNQLLYNGIARHNIARFEEVQLVRYRELLGMANNITFDTVRVYVDVKRQQELVRLAAENYRQHQTVFDQVEESFEAGVVRNSDLEQISGRMALAQSNLLTEQSNLHDVIARYLRVVGTLPPATLEDVSLESPLLSQDVVAQLRHAYQHNPRFLASLHNIEAERHNISANEGRNKPVFEFNASYGVRENDEIGIFAGTQREARVGVQMRYNLFRGGSDRANIRRSYELYNQAQDVRTGVCMDIRQDIQVSNNELKNLQRQIPNLRQHRNSSDRVRVAYSDQFGIGNRTLLDVLDSENEYFQASIAYTNAQYDEVIRRAALLSSMGSLTPVVGGAESHFPEPRKDSSIDVDFDYVCPQYDLGQYVNYG